MLFCSRKSCNRWECVYSPFFRHLDTYMHTLIVYTVLYIKNGANSKRKKNREHVFDTKLDQKFVNLSSIEYLQVHLKQLKSLLHFKAKQLRAICRIKHKFNDLVCFPLQIHKSHGSRRSANMPQPRIWFTFQTMLCVHCVHPPPGFDLVPSPKKNLKVWERWKELN